MDEKQKDQMERIMFATMVASYVKGNLEDLLKNAPVGYCEEMGRIWDAQCFIPVGVLLKRPSFEEYEAMNRAKNTPS